MHPLRDKLLSGFYGFWVKNYRIGIMGILLIGLLGFSGLLSIPKESSPDVKFGIVQIGTAYIGASPEDIDSLITTRVEKEIKTIDGIDSIASSSRQGFSSVVVTLEAEADTDKTVQLIRDAVDRVKLPEDGLDPSVNEIDTDSQRLFSVYLASKNPLVTQDMLMEKAYTLQKMLEGKYNIETVTIDGGEDSELEVQVDHAKLSAINITTSNIADQISQYNRSLPVGDFAVGNKRYDVRIEGDIQSFPEFLELPIKIPGEGTVPLGDFAEVTRKWSNDAVETINYDELKGLRYIQLTLNKEPRKSVFSTSKQVREVIEKYVSDLGPDWDIHYGFDLAEIISEDYANLGTNAWQTLLLVFACVFFFIGTKESLIAAVSIPLAFMISIMTLNWMNLSLNFMTNFSLVLSFGIAIDLTLVIIEETTKKTKLGYSPGMAVLLAIQELKLSVIASTAVTLIVFVPMMVLPGVIGKFLAYIPLTVFSTLLATLFLALTTNSSLFVRIAKNHGWYIRDPFTEKHMSPSEQDLLTEERKGKIERPAEQISQREQWLSQLENWYEGTLKWWMAEAGRRRLLIWGPIILTILSLFTLSPRLAGGSLFPSDDSPFIFVTVSAPPGTTQEQLIAQTQRDTISVAERIEMLPEIKFVTMRFSDNTLSLTVELTPSNVRKSSGQKMSKEIEKNLLEMLTPLRSEGLEVAIKSEQNGPPTGAPVSIKLVADTTEQFPALKQTVRDFEAFLRNIEGTKNITNTSQDSPGEIVLRPDRAKVAVMGVTPLQIYGTINALTRGSKAGTITIGDRDIDVIVTDSAHHDDINIDTLLAQTIETRTGPIAIGTLMTTDTSNALVDIRRVDGDLTISVESEVRDGFKAGDLLIELNTYAESYDFPAGVSYKKGGEFEANKELLVAVATAFVTSILLIFVILVFVFNSYSMPLIILYTIVLGFLGVNVGLSIVNIFNPAIGYNMPMGIGFISLMGLVVTNAIILIDKINRNRDSGMSPYDTVIDGGKTRMLPQIVTALTTIFGLLPTAFQDAFWASLSWTVIWGTIIATILTLYSIPALYYNVYGVKKTSKKHSA